MKIKRESTVWFISELFHPDETSTAHYLTVLATGLAKTRPVKAISAGTGSEPKHEVFNGVEIFRCRVPALDKNKILQRLLKSIYVTSAFLFIALRRIRRGDIVLAVTNPATLPLVLIPILGLRGVKTVLRIDDVYPDALAAARLTTRGNPLFAAFLAANRLLYLCTDCIVTIGRDMQAVIRSRTSHQKEKVVVIPNWADLEDIEPRTKRGNELLQKLGIEDKFVVLIAGNIGRVQGIATIVGAADFLRDRADICFLFVGSGALEPFLRQEIENRGLSNIKILPNQPRSMQTVFLNACDVTMLSLTENMFGIGVPSRLYNYMAAGKPVIGVVPPSSETALVIEEEGIGWVAPSGNARKLADTVVEASRSVDAPELGKKARLAAERLYSTEAIVRQYTELINSL